MGAAIEDDNPARRVEHQALLMGEIVPYQFITMLEVQMLTLTNGSKPRSVMGDQPRIRSEFSNPFNALQTIYMGSHHPLPDADVGHVTLGIAPAVLLTSRLEQKWCMTILLEEYIEAIRVIEMGMGENRVIHASQVNSERLSILSEYARGTGVQ
jgi:hypothetical protein